mmetsp:Transcript_33575/g.70636  ORF Transcript_33575/g.70636 Transcript_33575/m.70636 type:complete len:314 (+) Transcript_33575:123-1064(+)
MDLSDARRQVAEINALQLQTKYTDAIEITTPALFNRLEKAVVGSNSNGTLPVKKCISFEIKCRELDIDELSGLVLEIEFPLDYPSRSTCHVKAIQNGNVNGDASAKITTYLESFLGCESLELIIDWLADNKTTCLLSNDNNNNNNNAGKDECYKHEFDEDGIWTGNSTMGGTAFVHGSHRLSVTKQLLSEDDDDDDDDAATGSMGTTGNNNDDDDDDDDTATAIRKRQLLQLRTIRPSLDAGDVVFFDCRTIHYGLANTSKRKKRDDDDNDGTNVHRGAAADAAGRRPMLYLNVSQSWFHDPKNWDDRERIFD